MLHWKAENNHSTLEGHTEVSLALSVLLSYFKSLISQISKADSLTNYLYSTKFSQCFAFPVIQVIKVNTASVCGLGTTTYFPKYTKY